MPNKNRKLPFFSDHTSFSRGTCLLFSEQSCLFLAFCALLGLRKGVKLQCPIMRALCHFMPNIHSSLYSPWVIFPSLTSWCACTPCKMGSTGSCHSITSCVRGCTPTLPTALSACLSSYSVWIYHKERREFQCKSATVIYWGHSRNSHFIPYCSFS